MILMTTCNMACMEHGAEVSHSANICLQRNSLSYAFLKIDVLWVIPKCVQGKSMLEHNAYHDKLPKYFILRH